MRSFEPRNISTKDKDELALLSKKNVWSIDLLVVEKDHG